MCILFLYIGVKDSESDYSVIIVSNRDEYYDRPSQSMAPWIEDPNVVGGRDLEVNGEKGTWLAFSPLRNKLGVLLNLPGDPKPNAKSRGGIVANYIKNEKPLEDYIIDLETYAKECNDFIFISVELGYVTPSIYVYNNVTNELTRCTETHLGFGNSLPHEPLKKTIAGKDKLKDICNKFNKVTMKEKLIEELTKLLKSNQKHLPDQQLETRRPNLYQQLSSIFVSIPEGRYGTRTHTLLLVTKTGHVDLIEITMLEPIDPLNPKWGKTEFQFDI